MRPGRGAETPHPHLLPKVLEKSRAIPLLTLRACLAYKKGENLPILAIYLYKIILYAPLQRQSFRKEQHIVNTAI